MSNDLTILLIENDPIFLSKIIKKFSQALNGSTIVHVKNQASLTKNLKIKHIDWIITSDQLKWSTSLNILKKAKKFHKNCPVVILYAKDDPQKNSKIKKAREHGLEKHFHKNTQTPGNLVKLIKSKTTSSPTSLKNSQGQSYTDEIAKILAETELLNQNIIESVFDGLIVLDQDHIIKVWNRFMELITGYKAEETLGKRIDDIFPDFKTESFGKFLARILSGETFRSMDVPFYIKELGSTGWIESFFGPLLSTKGSPIGIIATFHEITDRKEREKEQEKSLKIQTKRAQELTAITTASTTISSNLNIHEVLTIVADQMITLLNVDSVAILEWNREDNTTLRLASSNIIDPPESFQGQTPKIEDRPLILDGLKNKTAVQIHSSDKKLPAKGKKHLKLSGIQSLLMVPLVTKNKTIGLIELNLQTETHQFTSQEITLARMLADQAAVAIQNARLYNATRSQLKQLTILHTLTAYGSEFNSEDDYISSATILISTAFYPEQFGFLMLDKHTQTLHHHESYIYAHPEFDHPIKLSEGITGKTARTGKSMLVNNVAEEPDYLALDSHSRSELCVPLKIDGEVIGVINAERTEFYAFDKTDLQLLTTFANQISSTIERLRTKQTELKQTRQLNILNALGQEMTGILNRRELSGLVAETLVTEFGYYSCAVFSYDPAAEEMVLEGNSAMYANSSGPGEYRQSIQKGLIGRSARTKKYVLANNVHQDPDYFHHKETDIQSELILPLLAESNLIGCIVIDSNDQNAFDLSDISALSTLSDHMALALEKARLFEVEQKQRKEAETLREIAETINTSTETNQVLHLILQQLKKVVSYDSASIMLLKGDDVIIEAASDKEFLGIRLKIAENKVAHPMIYEGKTKVYDNVRTNPNWIDVTKDSLIVSWIGAPLISRGTCIGLLTVDGYTEGQFTENDAQLVTTFASHSATAIDNARLFEIEQQQRQEAETLREIAETINTSTETDQVLDLVLQQLKKVVSYDSASIMLINDENIVTEAASDKEFLGISFTIKENLITHPMIYEGKTEVYNNINTNPDWIDATNDNRITSWIGVPLISRGTCIGLLTVDGYKEGQFTENDAQLVTTFANHSATAIDNARLFEETSQSLVREQQINQITQTLREGLDIGSQLNKIMELTCHAIEATSGTIGLISPDGNMLNYYYGYNDRNTHYVEIPKGQGIGWQSVQSKKSIILSNYQDHPDALPDVELSSVIYVPFRAGDKIIGVVNIYNNTNKKFDQRDLALVESIVQQMGIAYENARLFEETSQSLTREQQINQITQSLRKGLDIGSQLNEIVKLICQAIDADGGTIGILSSDENTLHYHYGYNAFTKDLVDIQKGEGVGWKAVDTNESQLISNYQDQPYALPEVKLLSAIVVPFRSADKTIGVLNIYNYNSKKEFGQRDLALVESIAQQMGIAYENSRLFEETSHSLTREQQINQITQRLTEVIDTDTLLNEIIKLTCQAIDAEAGTIGLITPDGKAVRHDHNYNEIDVQYKEVPKGQGVSWETIQTKKSIILNKYHDHPKSLPDFKAKAYIMVPFSAGGKIVGVFNIYNIKPENLFDDRDLALVESITRQLGIAFENTRLFEETYQALAREQQLNQITQRLTEGLDIEQTLNEIVRLTCQAVDANSGSLGLVSPDGATLNFDHGYNIENLHRSSSLKGEGLGWKIIKTKKSIFLKDYKTHPEAFPDINIRSFIGVPLFAGNKIIGMLGIYNTSENKYFDERDLALIESIVRQAGIAMENARLFEETSQALSREQQLNQITLKLSEGLGIDQMLKEVVEMTCQAVGADSGAVGLISPDKNKLDFRYVQTKENEIQQITVEKGKGVGWLIIETKKSIIIDDYNAHPRAVSEIKAKSFIGVPLIVNKEIIGVFGIYNQSETKFGQRDLALIESISRQAATTIQNAKLFQETTQALSREQQLNEISITLSNNTDIRTLLHIVTKNATEAIGATTGVIGLINKETKEVEEFFFYNRPEHITKETTQYSRTGLMQLAINTGKSILIENYADHPNASPTWIEAGFQSTIMVPLTTGEETFGGLGLFSQSPDVIFTQRDLDLAESIARQAAIAYQKARLLEEAQQRTKDLETLYNLTSAISENLDLEILLENITKDAALSLGATTSLIALGTKGAQELDRFFFYNRPDNPDPDLLTLNQGLVPSVIVSGVPIMTDNYDQHPLASLRWINVGFKACLVVPFTGDNQIIGALGLFSTDPEKTFTQNDLKLAQSISTQAGIGIQKSMLFEETNRRTQELEALYDIALATSSELDVQTLLHQLHTKVNQLLNPDCYNVYFYHDTNQKLEVMVSIINGETAKELIGTYSKIENSGLIGWVLQNNEPLLISDIHKDPSPIPLEDIDEPMRCWLGVPLLSHEQLIGGLSVWSEQPNAFNENDKRLLESLASQVATSLENASLYEELEDGFLQTVLALANAMDVRDNYTHDHSQRISLLTEKTGEALGCTPKELENLRLASLLHDIGKIGVPDDVLLKPSELTDEEYEVIKNHPSLGASIVAPVKKLEEVAPIIRSHQEKWDGTGYPDGLKGEEIHIGARILMVVDSYIAITDERIYREARTHEEAIAELRRLAGKQYDPHIVEVFVKVMDEEIAKG